MCECGCKMFLGECVEEYLCEDGRQATTQDVWQPLLSVTPREIVTDTQPASAESKAQIAKKNTNWAGIARRESA